MDASQQKVRFDSTKPHRIGWIPRLTPNIRDTIQNAARQIGHRFSCRGAQDYLLNISEHCFWRHTQTVPLADAIAWAPTREGRSPCPKTERKWRAILVAAGKLKVQGGTVTVVNLERSCGGLGVFENNRLAQNAQQNLRRNVSNGAKKGTIVPRAISQIGCETQQNAHYSNDAMRDTNHDHDQERAISSPASQASKSVDVPDQNPGGLAPDQELLDLLARAKALSDLPQAPVEAPVAEKPMAPSGNVAEVLLKTFQRPRCVDIVTAQEVDVLNAKRQDLKLNADICKKRNLPSWALKRAVWELDRRPPGNLYHTPAAYVFGTAMRLVERAQARAGPP